MRRLILFISSYIPLYVLLICKDILQQIETTPACCFLSILKGYFTKPFHINEYAVIFLLTVSIISCTLLCILIKLQPAESDYYSIVEIENRTPDVFLNYISLYLLSCFELSLNSLSDIFILLFIMLLIGFIYISNQTTYINPILQFMGYKLYECELTALNNGKCIKTFLIAPSKIQYRKGNRIKTSGNNDFLFIKKKR